MSCITSAISSIRLSTASGPDCSRWTFDIGTALWILAWPVRAVSDGKQPVIVGITGVGEDTGFVRLWFTERVKYRTWIRRDLVGVGG